MLMLLSAPKLLLFILYLNRFKWTENKFKNFGIKKKKIKILWQCRAAESCQHTQAAMLLLWNHCLWCVRRADIVVQWATAGQAAIVQAGFKNTSLVINNTQPLFKRSTVPDTPAYLTFRQNLLNTFTICSKILLLFNESILMCLFVKGLLTTGTIGMKNRSWKFLYVCFQFFFCSDQCIKKARSAEKKNADSD